MEHLRATASFIALEAPEPPGPEAEEITPPEWIEVFPAGPQIVARDGRTFLNDRPDGVIAAFEADTLTLPVDIEHATELRAPKGERAPAQGWVVELETRDGAIWGRVEWNWSGRYEIESRSYRYLSPTFFHEPDGGRILQLVSVALTNRPALKLKALFHNQPQHEPRPKPERKKAMYLTALCRKLGLNDDASMTSIIAAVETLQGERETALARAQSPDLERFVPRADHDQVAAERDEAVTALASVQEEARDAQVESAVGQAIKDGKIAPASKDYHTAQCRTEGGLERFMAYVASASKVIADPDPGALDGDPDKGAVTLSDAQKAIASRTGVSHEDYAKALAAQATA